MPVRHEIYYDSTTNRNTNYRNTMHGGLELDADIIVFDSARAFVNYTCQQAYFAGGPYAGCAALAATGAVKKNQAWAP